MPVSDVSLVHSAAAVTVHVAVAPTVTNVHTYCLLAAQGPSKHGGIYSVAAEYMYHFANLFYFIKKEKSF